jgi:hypothetical protein
MADPSTGTPPFSCYREGIGTLYLLADGKDRRKDVVKGCFIDQASDCAQKNPGTAMSPGANWDMEMPRAEKSSLP